jgi:thiamine-phosphate pyrophosphorylase
MLLTDDRLIAGRDVLELARSAVRGGVTAVQLRLKSCPPRQLLELALRLRETLPALVLVNDRPDVALAAGLGVHLGADDLPAALARRLLGREAVIGVSVGTPEEVANGQEGSYWGVGPLRGSTTKRDAGGALGIEGFQRIAALAGGRPCLAVGGVRPSDVRPVLAAGGAGVAVASGILEREDVEAAAREYSAEC